MFDLAHKIEGTALATRAMKELGYEVSYKGGRSALRKAAKLVSEAVKVNARRLDDPQTAEQISENVAIRWGSKKFKSSGDLMFRVGILGGARASGTSRKRRAGQRSLAELGEIVGKGKGNPGGDTFYWRFLEFGTRNVRAHPFMRPALERNTQAATVEFVKNFKKAIARAVKRAQKGEK